MTIAEKLDKLFPVKCDICHLDLLRSAHYWPICPSCKHNQVGVEAHTIRRIRAWPQLSK